MKHRGLDGEQETGLHLEAVCHSYVICSYDILLKAVEMTREAVCLLLSAVDIPSCSFLFSAHREDVYLPLGADR